MNWDTVGGEWQEIKGKLRTKWGKLTDDDLEVIKGRKEMLVGRLQKRYGYEKDRAESEIESFLNGR